MKAKKKNRKRGHSGMALLLATAMAAGALTGCGSSSGAGETSTETSSKSEEAVVETSGETDNTDTESGEESSSAESDIAELSPEEEAAVGTYLGAYGSYITLHKDRTADYYMALDTIKTGTWEISDGKIRVETSAWVIAADAQEDEDSQYTFTSVSGDWEDEYFKKVTSDDTSYTEDGYLELREQTVPIADKKQRKGFDEASNSTLEIGDGTLSIPEYWGDPSSDDSPVYYYVQDGTPFTMFMISTLSFDDEEETKAIWQEDAVYASLLSGYMSGADNTGDLWISEYDAQQSGDSRVLDVSCVGKIEADDATYDIIMTTYFILMPDYSGYTLTVMEPVDSSCRYTDDLQKVADSLEVNGESAADTKQEEAAQDESTDEAGTEDTSQQPSDSKHTAIVKSYQPPFQMGV